MNTEWLRKSSKKIKMKKINKLFKGQMLLELLLVIGISAIIFPALLTGFIASREGKPQQKQRMQAVTLLQETQQAAASVKDMGWVLFATFSAVPLHPVVYEGKWALLPGSDTINGLTRQLIISDVYRDTNGIIVSSGGTIDPSIKKITSTVSWAKPFGSTLTSVMYLSRTENTTQSQTTLTDFNAGTKNSVLVNATVPSGIPDDGQLQLATGRGDWCKPSDYIAKKLTLPKPGNAIVAFPGSAIGFPDSVYAGTGDGSPGASFVNISISDPQPAATPEASIIGTYSSSETTNAVYANNGYAYLATNATTNQVRIIRLSDSTLYRSIDLGSHDPAEGLYIANNVLYVTSDDRIYIYNVSNLDNIQQLPSQRIHANAGGATAEQVVVVGTKLYVSVSNSNLGLQVYSINVGGSLNYLASGKINWNAEAKGLAVNSTGNRAYVAFTSTDIPSGFYIVDTSRNGDNPYIGTAYNANNMAPKGIALATSDIAILVGENGAEQYQVINNLMNDNPVRCGGMPVTNGANGIATVSQQDSDVYSYVISGESQDQFMIIEGGNGGASTTTGTFDSATIDASYSAAFNRFIANVNKPPNTSIQMQVAVAQAPPPGTSCDGATFTFVGPNGSPTDYFTPVGATVSGQIPFGSFPPSYQNPARCFKYRTILSTLNPNFTPFFYDVIVNHSQ